MFFTEAIAPREVLSRGTPGRPGHFKKLPSLTKIEYVLFLFFVFENKTSKNFHPFLCQTQEARALIFLIIPKLFFHLFDIFFLMNEAIY